MIGIMMYYWRDARKQKEKGRQMLRDTGLQRTLCDRALDALESMISKPARKRAARWTDTACGSMAQQKIAPTQRQLRRAHRSKINYIISQIMW